MRFDPFQYWGKVLFSFAFLFLLSLLPPLGGNFITKPLDAEARVQDVQEEVLDLKKWDPGQEPILEIQEPISFTPGVWIFEPNANTIKTSLRTLSDWNSINPPLPDAKVGTGIGTYSLLLDLPSHPSPIGIYIYILRTTAKIYQDGELVYEHGKMGLEEDRTEDFSRKRILFPLKKNQSPTRLVIHVKNWTVFNGGLWKKIILAPISTLESKRNSKLSQEPFLAGGLVLLGLYELGQFLTRRKMISSLWFFGFCLLMSIRILTTGERTLLYMFPQFPEAWVFRLEYLSFYAGVSTALVYVWTFTKEFLNFRILLAIQIFFLPGYFIALFGSFYLLTQTLGIFQILAVVSILLALYLVFRFLLSRQEGYVLFSLSVILVIVASINDLIFARGLQSSLELLPLGLLAFVVLQALFLSKRFTKEILDAEGNLKAAQYQLVQSEKLSSLGTIVAGVAHEINSPLSAITASSSLLSEKLQNNFQNLPKVTKRFSELEWKAIEEWLRLMNSASESLTSKEARQIKKEMISKLDERGLSFSEDLAEFLVSLGCREMKESWIEAFLKESGKDFLETAREILSMLQNSQTIQIASLRAGKIVKSLKSFSHFDPNAEKKIASINESLETVLIILNSNFKTGVELIKDLGAIPTIPCYPDELNQVWTNLIQNAVQAMDGKGILKVKTELRSKGQENFVAVTIEDNGKGIPQEYKEKIFDPFFTTKPVGEGTGLGLHITKQVIEKHQGKIELESQVGRTTFTILLPEQ